MPKFVSLFIEVDTPANVAVHETLEEAKAFVVTSYLVGIDDEDTLKAVRTECETGWVEYPGDGWKLMLDGDNGPSWVVELPEFPDS